MNMNINIYISINRTITTPRCYFVGQKTLKFFGMFLDRMQILIQTGSIWELPTQFHRQIVQDIDPNPMKSLPGPRNPKKNSKL